MKVRDKKLHFKTYDEFDVYCVGKDVQRCTVKIDEELSDLELCRRYKGLMINTRTGKVINEFLPSKKEVE